MSPDLPESSSEEAEVAKLRSTAGSEPEKGSAVLVPAPGRGSRRVFRVTLAAFATVLVVAVLLGSFVLIRSVPAPSGAAALGQRSTMSSVSTQKQGSVTVYSVTPQGGPPPPVTPGVRAGGLMILTPPIPAFFLAGNVYRNNEVYRADTGALARQYLNNLGAVAIYQPRLVGGILYMAARTEMDQGPGKMVMYALRASDGAVLWQWSECGEDVNMSAPTIINSSVYFVCEAAPSVYRLYALRASSGTRLWLDTFNGEVSFDLIGDQQALYIQMNNQILAESTANGQFLWQRHFDASDQFIRQTELGNGMIYLSQDATFSALKTSDGTTLWKYQFIGDYTYIDVVNAQNEVYLFAHEMSRPAFTRSIAQLAHCTGRSN
jgi:hypothetical protein